jgi:hypothetical protein
MKSIFYCTLIASICFSQDATKNYSLAAGLGLEYAVLGLHTEYEGLDHLHPFLAIGGTPTETNGTLFSYAFGTRYYFYPKEDHFRLFGTVLYGTTTLLQKVYVFGSGKDTSELRNGMSLGLGFRWLWGDSKRSGISFSLHKVIFIDISSEEEEFFEIGNGIKPNIGFCYLF